MDHIPQGWHISESINGIVSLVKDYPPQILPEEIAVVEAELGRHPKSRNYRVAVKRSRIEVYERTGPDAEQLLTGLARLGLGVVQASDEWRAKVDRDARFAPVLRFILADARQRTFYTQRWCYLGSIDDWIHIGPTGPISQLAYHWIWRLGTDAFFDVYP